MRYFMLAVVAAAAVLTGCAPAVSIHPMYTAQDLVADAALEGKWADDDSGEVWQIAKAGANLADGYDVTVFHPGDSPSTESFHIHVLRLQGMEPGMEFADAVSKGDPGLGIVGHVIVKIHVQGDELRVALMSDAWLKTMVEAGLAPQPVTDQESGRIILTGSTGELRQFLAQHAADAGVWDEDGGLHRVH